MKINVLLVFLCAITLVSCKKHSCTCSEYKGKSVVNEYEKSIDNTSTCEELSKTAYEDTDTIQIVCGESNPL